MSKLLVYSRNALCTWAGYGANLAVLLVLSPFVVRTLGDRAYGVWTMLMGLTGYLGLAEMGVRVSTGRFINVHLGRRDAEAVNRVVVTSLAFYAVVGTAVLAVTAALGAAGPRLLGGISPELAPATRWVLPLLGLNIALGFLAATCGQLLQSADRFDLRVRSDLGALAMRVAATVLALKTGSGLIGLALANVATTLTGLLLRLEAARRCGPPVRLQRRYICRRTLGEVMRFGAWSFLSNGAALMIHYTDAIVIGFLLGPEAVTVYAIGLMLVEHGRRVIFDGVGVVSPDILKAAGRGDRAALHRLMISGTRASAALALPMLAGFIVLGGQFIELWMGPGHQGSARVLWILTLSLFGGAAARPAITVLSGLGAVRFQAAECLAEGLLNLGLSLALIAWAGWGVEGAAWGTVAPMVLFNNLLVPIVACRRMGLPVGRFWAATAGRWAPAAALTLALTFAIDAWMPGQGWLGFAAKAAALLVCYAPLALGLVLGEAERARVLQTAGRLLTYARGEPARSGS